MHDPCILVGLIEIGVETACYVARADTSVAHVDRYLCHDILFKILGEWENARATYTAMGGVYKLSVRGELKQSEMRLVARQSLPNHPHAKEIQRRWRL